MMSFPRLERSSNAGCHLRAMVSQGVWCRGVGFAVCKFAWSNQPAEARVGSFSDNAIGIAIGIALAIWCCAGGEVK